MGEMTWAMKQGQMGLREFSFSNATAMLMVPSGHECHAHPV